MDEAHLTKLKDLPERWPKMSDRERIELLGSSNDLTAALLFALYEARLERDDWKATAGFAGFDSSAYSDLKLRAERAESKCKDLGAEVKWLKGLYEKEIEHANKHDDCVFERDQRIQELEAGTFSIDYVKKLQTVHEAAEYVVNNDCGYTELRHALDACKEKP